MDKFLYAHAGGASAAALLDRCLTGLGPVPREANLGFIYATDTLADELPMLLEALRAGTGVEHWVGTLGLGICATGTEYYDEPALAVLVGDFPPGSFRVFQGLPAAASPAGSHGNARFAVVHGDPRNGKLPEHIARLPALIGDGFLVGGLTASQASFQQVADGLTEGQLSGVVFEPEVRVVSALTQGCSPIGPVHTVNECQGNVAVRIDERPALDVLKEDMGELLARDLNRAAGYIFAGFPVRGSDTGDYLVRNLLGMDSARGLLAVGDRLEIGQGLLFCRRDAQTAVQDLERMLADLKSRLPGPPRGGVYHSCLGRGHTLFGEASEELRIIAEALGPVPLVGFYANGEISGDRLYGYTGVLSLFV